MQQGQAATSRRTATLTGSWPTAAIAMIERALQLNGEPLELVNDDVNDGPQINRNDCRVLYRQDGRAMYGGDIPVEGMVVDGIEIQLQLVYPGTLVSHSLRPKRARVADGRGLVANGS